jgi:hypothetical protein
MDLLSTTKVSGRRWQPARIVAMVFFALTCGLLVSSLLNARRAGVALGDAPRWALR